jgi:hypothetical protein
MLADSFFRHHLLLDFLPIGGVADYRSERHLMRRVEDRSGDRRVFKGHFLGDDRRHGLQDRRKVKERRKPKPAMSEAGRNNASPNHSSAYVASFVAASSNVTKASYAEARMVYGRPQALKTASLLRGLSLDSDIS